MNLGNEEIAKKGYELAYAAFRIGGGLPSESSYRQKLEAYALEALDLALRRRIADLEGFLGSFSYLIRFGSDAQIISNGNAELILSEASRFEALLKETKVSVPEKGPTDVDLQGIFKNTIHFQKDVQTRQKNNKASNTLRVQSGNPAEQGVSSRERQEVIVNKVKTVGDCRLRDIAESLPGSSERTIRYDLQALVGSGVIERVGSGGPGTFYRLRTSTPVIEEDRVSSL